MIMMEKDVEKAKRLNEVYKYVFANYDIKSKTDFADYLKVQRTGLSAAMNGNKANLTKNLFIKICAAFPETFNLDYLLTGEGSLLLEEEEKEPKQESQPTGQADLLEIYAQRIRMVDDLRETMKSELNNLREIITEFKQARDDLRDATSRLSRLYGGYSITEHSVTKAAENPPEK